MEQMICVVCAKTFIPRNSRNRYCSAACREKAKCARARKPAFSLHRTAKERISGRYSDQAFVNDLIALREQLNRKPPDPNDRYWGKRPHYERFLESSV